MTKTRIGKPLPILLTHYRQDMLDMLVAEAEAEGWVKRGEVSKLYGRLQQVMERPGVIVGESVPDTTVVDDLDHQAEPEAEEEKPKPKRTRKRKPDKEVKDE